jgi:signal transduction histidine kinase
MQSISDALLAQQPAVLVTACDAHENRVIHQVLARVGDGFLALDAQRRITYVNAKAAELLATEPGKNLLGRLIWDEFPQALGTPLHLAIEAAMQTQQAVLNVSHLTPKGRVFEGRIYPAEDGLTIYFSDATERQHQEAALRLSEERYRLAAMHGHVWDWNISTGEVNFPSAFWQLFALPVPAAPDTAKSFQALMHPDDLQHWRGVMRHHLAHGAPYEMVYRARQGGADGPGEWRWFQTYGQALWNTQGRATYIAGTTFEISARVRAEQAVQQLRQELSELANRLLTQERDTSQRLAQSLHDHLGQTLAVARLNLDACLSSHASQMPAALKSQGEHIAQLLDRAVQEVRQVLAVLRPPSLQEHGLAAALEDEIYAHAPVDGGAEMLLEVAATAADLHWPADVEYAAFMVAREAITNALQHAGAALIRVVLQGDAQTLCLQIIDDGCGIAWPLTRGRPGHLGIVGMRERCHAVGANFSIAPDSDGGSRVCMQWPAGQKPVAQTP